MRRCVGLGPYDLINHLPLPCILPARTDATRQAIHRATLLNGGPSSCSSGQTLSHRTCTHRHIFGSERQDQRVSSSISSSAVHWCAGTGSRDPVGRNRNAIRIRPPNPHLISHHGWPAASWDGRSASSRAQGSSSSRPTKGRRIHRRIAQRSVDCPVWCGVAMCTHVCFCRR